MKSNTENANTVNPKLNIVKGRPGSLPIKSEPGRLGLGGGKQGRPTSRPTPVTKNGPKPGTRRPSIKTTLTPGRGLR